MEANLYQVLVPRCNESWANGSLPITRYKHAGARWKHGRACAMVDRIQVLENATSF